MKSLPASSIEPDWMTVSVDSLIPYQRSAAFPPVPMTECTAQRLFPSSKTLPMNRGATFSIVRRGPRDASDG